MISYHHIIALCYDVMYHYITALYYDMMYHYISTILWYDVSLYHNTILWYDVSLYHSTILWYDVSLYHSTVLWYHCSKVGLHHTAVERQRQSHNLHMQQFNNYVLLLQVHNMAGLPCTVALPDAANKLCSKNNSLEEAGLTLLYHCQHNSWQPARCILTPQWYAGSTCPQHWILLLFLDDLYDVIMTHVVCEANPLGAVLGTLALEGKSHRHENAQLIFHSSTRTVYRELMSRALLSSWYNNIH